MNWIRDTWEKMIRHRYVSAVFALSACFVLAGWLWSFFALRSIKEPLIIHFSSLTGITQTGTPGDLGKIGFIGLVVIAVNFLIALELEERDKFLGKFLAAVTLTLAVLLFIAFSAIISVN